LFSGKDRLRKSHQEGYRQGMWTALIIASPFIVAGAKWMMENTQPIMDSVDRIKKTDFYSGLFDKEFFNEKKANERLQSFRAGEGMVGDDEPAVSRKKDEDVFHALEEITRNELQNKNKK
jgi:hypothetical protein